MDRKEILIQKSCTFLLCLITFSLLSCSSISINKAPKVKKTKKYISIKPKQEFNKYRAIIDQKLSYYCFLSKSLKKFNTEQKCIEYINSTYRRCMDKNEWIESPQLVQCIDKYLNI